MKNKKNETDIIEGEADIIEPVDNTPKTTAKPHPSASRLALVFSVLSVLISVTIGTVGFREWTILHDRQQNFEALELQLESHSHDYENQISLLLSQSQKYETEMNDVKRQLAELSASFQETKPSNISQLDSAILVSMMMWQVADDDRLGALSSLVASLSDSDVKAQLGQIVEQAQQLQIDALLNEGNKLLNSELSGEQAQASEDAVKTDGLLDRLSTWFSGAVKLEAIETDASPSPQRERRPKMKTVMSLPELVKHLESSDDDTIKSWVRGAKSRLELRSKLEELIIVNLNYKRDLP